MLSKCANPTCEQTLLYLREGKVFKVESELEGPFVMNGRKPTRKVEHFWLCGPCSEHWTIAYDRSTGVRIEAKPLVRRAAAS